MHMIRMRRGTVASLDHSESARYAKVLWIVDRRISYSEQVERSAFPLRKS